MGSENGMYRAVGDEMQRIRHNLRSWASYMTDINQDKGIHDNR